MRNDNRRKEVEELKQILNDFDVLRLTGNQIIEEICQLYAGYVPLAKDQILPPVVSYKDTEYNRGFTEGSKYERADMLKGDTAGVWRKVILEE